MKTSFYVIYYNKPDFIKFQYDLIRKYCTDDYEYIIVNNGKDNEKAKIITDFCTKNKIREVQTYQFRLPKVYDHTRVLKYVYKELLSKDNSDFRVIMDQDIFPYGKFNIGEIIKDNDIAGIKLGNPPHYVCSFIMIHGKNLDLSNINIRPESAQDASMWTWGIEKKYKVKWINHTTQGYREIYYIFRNIPVIIEKYKEIDNKKITFQIIENNFLHYWQGSEWNNHDKIFHAEKFDFIKFVIENINPDKLVLDNIVYYDSTIHDQWWRPKLYPLNDIDINTYINDKS